MSTEADRQAKHGRPPSRRWVVTHLLFALAFWVVVVVKGTDISYYFAIAFTIRLALDGTWQWLRSKGVPEWTANEAYISRLRRWHRSRTTT
jgi:predicted PurR-regulated permease PerM